MSWTLFRFASRTVPFLDSHKTNTDGILELRTRPPRRLLVWHPEGIDWIFRADQKLHPVPSRTLSPLLGRTSLLWADDPRHTAYRRILGPALHGPALGAYHPIISHAVHAALDVLAPKTVISLISWTRQITLRIISQILLNHADDLLLRSFTSYIDSVLDLPSRTLAYHFLPASVAAWLSSLNGGRELDKMCLRTAKATANSSSPALAALLLTGHEPLGPLEDHELRDQILSLLFAGYETTASATAWTLYWLSRDDKVRRDIVAELNATSHDGSDPSQVPLLHAATHEALRLCPPAFIAGKRRLPTDGKLIDTPLAAGTILTPCIYLAHHHPDLFPHPHRFDPTRFLGKRVPRQHYFPFGGGTRRCVGSELALLEIRMITAAVLHRRQLRCINPDAGTPVLRGPALTLPPHLRMSLTPHR